MSSIENFLLMSFGFGSGPKLTEVIKLFSCSLLLLCQSLQFHQDAIQAFRENGLIFYIVTSTRPDSQQQYSKVQKFTFQYIPVSATSQFSQLAPMRSFLAHYLQLSVWKLTALNSIKNFYYRTSQFETSLIYFKHHLNLGS